MEVYIKESLYVLDYEENIKDAIFISDDHITPGYAYGINIDESNTGYSNLTFNIPNTIITNEGDKIKNPKLALLTPLVKLRYKREVTYQGDHVIKVQEPLGYGDTTTYIPKEYKPGQIIEEYIMDYIVQPVEKKRNNLEIATTFTAIDYPRFNLSKKKFGMAINDDTVTRSDWSLYEREPMDIAGTVKYLRWDNKYAKYGETYEWNPETATEMPLLPNNINSLLEDTDLFSYGVIATTFWWPIVSTGRYNGILYEEGDYLTLNFYKTNITITDKNVISVGEDVKVFTKCIWLGSKDSGRDGWEWSTNITDADWLAYSKPVTDETYLGAFSDEGSMPKTLTTKDEGKWCFLVVDRKTNLNFYGYEWGTLDKGNWYLTPNNACNYLNYALENTNWEIKHTDDRYINTYFGKTFPTITSDTDDFTPPYLIYKEINDNTDYKGMFPNKQSLPTLTKDDIGKWALIQDTNGDKVVNTIKWVWTGSTWIYDYNDKDELTTKFYAWYKDTSSFALQHREIIGHWVDVTTDAWTSSIDKKTGVLYDVDEVTTEVAKPDGASGAIFETTELRSSLSASDSNSYNIITSICKEFQLYPIFDCINRTVSLKLFSGKNYGLAYQLGGALTSSTVKADGEKVITKLRCYGGDDIQSSEKINLGDANRKYKKYVNGYYKNTSSLPTKEVEGYWAIVDPNLTDKYWEASTQRKLYGYRNSQWNIINPYVKGTYPDDMLDGYTFIPGHYYWLLDGIWRDIDIETGMELPWDPNDPQYIQSRSPYGTEYVYNFKWMYDNKWMTKEQILGLYQVNDKIQELNYGFLDTYADDFEQATANYVNEGVNYKTNQDVYQSVINSAANTYYYKPSQPNAGSFIAFPYRPGGCTEKLDPKTNYPRYYATIYHCSNCGKYTATSDYSQCPICRNVSKKVTREVRIPVFNDADFRDTEADRLKPSKKGDYQTLLELIGDNSANRLNINIAKKFETKKIDTLTDEVQFKIGGEWKYDTSENMYEWNYNVDKWVEYYGYMIDSQIAMIEAGHLCTKLEQDKHNYDTQIAELENTVQDGWGDYIVEGKFADDQIVYVGILLNKSLDASEQYCIPKVTYSLNVIDTTGLIEYRSHCDDVYNDLVHTLHNIGQIVPKPGDYCRVYDEPMGLFGVPGLITGIKRVIDDPKSNSITIDTSYTDSEELVGNIITATNTVLNNSDIYARTAVLKADGTIAASALSNSMENSSGENISFIGVNGSSLLDSSGLIVTDPADPNKKMKYVGNGVYGTSDNGSSWQSMMTPEGINASYIRAGSINTQNVQINSGLYNKVVLDQFGLSVKKNASEPYSLPYRTTTYGSDTVPDWSTTNLSAFLGVDRENEAKLYVAGQIVADKGSKIGGWFIGESDLYNAVTNPNYILSPGGVSKTNIYSGSNDTDYNLYVNGKFGVTTGGILHATGAQIKGSGEFSGKITCNTDSTINGALGQVAADSVTLSANGVSGTVNGHSDSWAIYSKGNFGVTTGGHLYATNASVSGTISTTNLSASGTVTINDAIITKATLSSCSISAAQIDSGTFDTARIPNLDAGKITSGYISASRIKAGSITADKISVTTLSAVSGELGSVKAGTLEIGAEGYLKFTDASGNSTLRVTRYGNLYVNGDSESSSSVAIMADGNVYFGSASHDGKIYVYGDGGVFGTSRHLCPTFEMQVQRTLTDAITFYFVKGFCVGWRG